MISRIFGRGFSFASAIRENAEAETTQATNEQAKDKRRKRKKHIHLPRRARDNKGEESEEDPDFPKIRPGRKRHAKIEPGATIAELKEKADPSLRSG